jgi:hypothetical protein
MLFKTCFDSSRAWQIIALNEVGGYARLSSLGELKGTVPAFADL